jgi:hypothetical protein
MSYRILQNRKNLSATVLFTGNTTLTIAGNTSVSAIATSDEVLTGANINQAWCGSPSGASAYWEVKRGANTVAVLDSTAYIDYAGNGASITIDNNATLVVTLFGTPGTLMLELQKVGQFTSEYLRG